MLLSLRINSGRAVVFTASFLSLPILTYIRTSQLLKSSAFSHWNSNGGFIPRTFTTDLAGVCRHSARVSEGWRCALGLEPGLASWPACPVECGGHSVLCFEKSLTSAFILPFPKPHVKKKFNDPAGDQDPARHRRERPGASWVPAEQLREGPQWPQRVKNQRTTGWAQPALRTVSLDKLLFSAINLGVVCYTEINNWKINDALKRCL